jgi:hypothetical protein
MIAFSGYPIINSKIGLKWGWKGGVSDNVTWRLSDFSSSQEIPHLSHFHNGYAINIAVIPSFLFKPNCLSFLCTNLKKSKSLLLSLQKSVARYSRNKSMAKAMAALSLLLLLLYLSSGIMSCLIGTLKGWCCSHCFSFTFMPTSFFESTMWWDFLCL